MKKYNKSHVMRSAWKRFKANNGLFSFSECLIDAWAAHKRWVDENNTHSRLYSGCGFSDGKSFAAADLSNEYGHKNKYYGD